MANEFKVRDYVSFYSHQKYHPDILAGVIMKTMEGGAFVAYLSPEGHEEKEFIPFNELNLIQGRSKETKEKKSVKAKADGSTSQTTAS
jgi:hypothetical protein